MRKAESSLFEEMRLEEARGYQQLSRQNDPFSDEGASALTGEITRIQTGQARLRLGSYPQVHWRNSKRNLCFCCMNRLRGQSQLGPFRSWANRSPI